MEKKMKRENATSVNFDKSIIPIKDYYAGLYGLKSLVSAGLILFSRLKKCDQEDIILEVNNTPKEIKGAVDEILARFENIRSKRIQNPHGRAGSAKSAV